MTKTVTILDNKNGDIQSRNPYVGHIVLGTGQYLSVVAIPHKTHSGHKNGGYLPSLDRDCPVVVSIRSSNRVNSGDNGKGRDTDVLFSEVFSSLFLARHFVRLLCEKSTQYSSWRELVDDVTDTFILNTMNAVLKEAGTNGKTFLPLFSVSGKNPSDRLQVEVDQVRGILTISHVSESGLVRMFYDPTVKYMPLLRAIANKLRVHKKNIVVLRPFSLAASDVLAGRSDSVFSRNVPCDSCGVHRVFVPFDEADTNIREEWIQRSCILPSGTESGVVSFSTGGTHCFVLKEPLPEDNEKNITKDITVQIGGLTSDDFRYMVRDVVRLDGEGIHPFVSTASVLGYYACKTKKNITATILMEHSKVVVKTLWNTGNESSDSGSALIISVNGEKISVNNEPSVVAYVRNIRHVLTRIFFAIEEPLTLVYPYQEEEDFTQDENEEEQSENVPVGIIHNFKLLRPARVAVALSNKDVVREQKMKRTKERNKNRKLTIV